jgi:starch-binding outer membrane protein, SusD/RagB family
MKKMKLIISSLSLILLFAACNDDFLDKKPADKLSAGNVWEDPGLIQLFMNDMYRKIGHGYSICPLSCFVDEAVFTPNWGAEDFNNCLLSPDNLYYWTGDPVVNLMQWNELYKSIRNVNTFFENYDPSVVSYEVQQKRFIGEAYFFRAYYYHWLTFLYGGVPIIEKVYGLGDDYSVTRNTFEECVNYIVVACDSAIQYLPENYNEDPTNKGRATQGAAMALKARTLLYAASELYNNTSWAAGYDHPELIGYQGGDRTARWREAKDAAKAIIDAGWYSLYKPDPAATDSVALNFIELFTSLSSTEDIFLRYFTLTDQGYEWNEYNPGKFYGPNGYHNWGNNTPTLQLVDAYEMKDGSAFDWENPVHAANPFSNREPRFYATILYNGAKWRQRTTDVMTVDPIGLIDTKTSELYKVPPESNPADTIQIAYGIDTRNSPYEDWNGTYTGFYMRKFIVEELDGQYTIQEVPWRFYRYTEVLLNYAEACIELGEEDEARTYINMIRRRAGIPEISSSVTGDELRQKCRHERRIELAFENHRFFDVRRWMIASEAYQTVQGLETYYPLAGHTEDNQTIPGTPRYTPYESTPQARSWLDRAYFFPIWRDEMNKNLLLIQNPFYE